MIDDEDDEEEEEDADPDAPFTISISSPLPYSGHPEEPPNHSKPDCTSFTGTSYTHLK